MPNIKEVNVNFREEFHIPIAATAQEGALYLCGHAFGLQPKSVASFIKEELDIWRKYAIEGYFKNGDHWFSYHKKLSPSLAPLLGAYESEIVAMNSLTTNIHLMLLSFYKPTQQRYKILTDAPAFPSDKYALESAIKRHGFDPQEALIQIPTLTKNTLITTDQLVEVIKKNQDCACLLWLNPVNYFSGQRFDIAAIAKVCHQYDIAIGLDLAHSIGNISLELHAWQVDCAVWCSYKYLNGGPGAIGGCFVHKNHHDKMLPCLEGWWGQPKETRFLGRDQFQDISTMETWQLSNPPVLLMAALRAALDIFDKTSVTQLAEVSREFTDFFENLLVNSRINTRLKIINNRPHERGNMLCMWLTQNSDVPILRDRLREGNIAVDFRCPDIIRVSFCPLYNTRDEVLRFFEILEDALYVQAA